MHTWYVRRVHTINLIVSLVFALLAYKVDAQDTLELILPEVSGVQPTFPPETLRQASENAYNLTIFFQGGGVPGPEGPAPELIATAEAAVAQVLRDLSCLTGGDLEGFPVPSPCHAYDLMDPRQVDPVTGVGICPARNCTTHFIEQPAGCVDRVVRNPLYGIELRDFFDACLVPYNFTANDLPPAPGFNGPPTSGLPAPEPTPAPEPEGALGPGSEGGVAPTLEQGPAPAPTVPLASGSTPTPAPTQSASRIQVTCTLLVLLANVPSLIL
mmetsp:Transcript_11709/g.35144  ORF Transcript_11709/g.35144 Transcript_11709/m.35144 type:complete len:270 (-) Transcript_11709:658-1467(-)